MLLGLVLVVVGWLLSLFLHPFVVAALLLGLWILLTGALHLDGLGDCVDACLAPTRQRTLEIMKDPRAGPMAVADIGVVLLVKFAALVVLVEQQHFVLLMVAPILGRVGAQCLFLSTPYVSENGLGSQISQHMQRDRVMFMVLVLTVIAMFLAGIAHWWLVAVLVGVFLLLRALMMRKLLGTTGDSAGGLIEILEASTLALIA